MTMCDGAGLGPRETGTSPGMVKVPEPEETEGLGASWEIMLILRSFISVHATQPAEGVCTTLQPAGMPPARAPAGATGVAFICSQERTVLTVTGGAVFMY